MSEELQKKVTELNAGVDGLLSQLDAHREQLNEAVTSCLNVRANMLHFKKHNNRLVSQLAELQKHVDTLNKQLEEANNRIASLEAEKVA